MLWKQLFARKSLATLHAEAAGEGGNRLRRILGPIGLTSLGIGAIIGAGIFVMTGRVAAQDAGPAIVLSYVVAGIGCTFAAFCYSEFASMAPVAGSAYTYAYATLGELLAWIIGWDLILEYAMACAVVAAGWTHYLNKFLQVLAGVQLPMVIASDPFSTPGAWFNLPAVAIIIAVTVVLVIGIRESATTNAILVGVKVGVVIFVIVVGLAFVQISNWTGIDPANRIKPEELLIPDLAAKEVKEGGKLPEDAAKRRVQKITLWALLSLKVDRKQKETTAREEQLKALVHTAVTFAERQLPEVKPITEEGKKKTRKDADETRAVLVEVIATYTARLRQQGRMTDAEATKVMAEAVGQFTHRLELEKLMSEKEAQESLIAAQTTLQQTPPPLPEERAVVEKLLKEVEKEKPGKVTAKWGMLGYLGLNSVLEGIDDSFRSPFMPYGLSGIIFGASLVFFAYIGFDAISTHSEEAKKPQRDVPIGILASLAICTVLYILVSAVITGMEPYPDIDQKAAVATAFSKKATETNSPLLNVAALLIATGALAGLTSVLLITFLSQARIFLAMARDRLLPPAVFGAVHTRFRTPHISTMLTGGIIAVVAAFTPISDLEEMVNIGTLMAFVIVCAAVLILRIKQPDAPRPFRTPFLWVMAPLGILVNFTLMLFLPPITWLRLVVWLAVGLLIYFTYGIHRSLVGKELALGLPEGSLSLEIQRVAKVEQAEANGLPADAPPDGPHEPGVPK